MNGQPDTALKSIFDCVECGARQGGPPGYYWPKRMENGGGSSRGESFLSRMALNDNKAGMEGLDRDKINKIIMETSKGSKFYENELKKEQQVNQRIEKMMLQKAQITEQQLKRAQDQVDMLTSDLQRSRDLSRVIVHVDMDAFYAAVEMRDCPDLKEKPMAVGCMSMLSTSNYHARKFGVRAAMPGFIAKKLCPDLVIVPTNFDKYKAVSAEIREIFADYDPHFQPLSLDEAYLDFTDHLEKRRSWPDSLRTHHIRNSATTAGEVQGETHQELVAEAEGLSPVLFDDSPDSPSCPQDSRGTEVKGGVEVFGTSAEEAVREMRFRIEQRTALTASAGIAPNMMLAKVCSEKNKPNGQYCLPSNRQAIMDFVQDLPVRKVFGIGKVSEKMLGGLGITTCAQLCQQMALLSLLFSETAWHHFIRISLGLGATHIERDGERKSMSTERTFREMSAVEDQLSLCRELCQDLSEDLKKEGLKGKTVTLKLKNVNFEVKSRAWTLPCAVSTVDEIFAVAKDLLKTEIENISPQPLKLRLMGVRISSFVSSDEKKPLQKSIVGFLQQGGADSGGSSQVHIQRHGKSLKPSTQNGASAFTPSTQQRPQDGQRQGNEVPWLVRLKGQEVGRQGEQQQSFFQRAHAQRLRLQAESANTSADTDRGDSSALSPLGAHTQDSDRVSPTKTQSNRKFFGSNIEPFTSTTENDSTFPNGAQASASGWRGTDTESLTCPVCFSKVETTDLNVFNRHIDQCLSGFSTKPVKVTDSASESDTEADRDHSAWDAVEEEEFDAEHGCGKGNTKQKEDSGITKLSLSNRIGSKSEITAPTMRSLPTNPEYLQQNNDKKPKDGVHSSQVSMVHDDYLIVKGTSHDSPKTSALTCPVCQETQDTEDLTIFNRHIDLCLNQEVLHELGGQSSSSMDQKAVSLTSVKVKERDGPRLKPGNNGKTKRQGSPTPPPSKKAKAHGSAYTIDKFFR